MSWRSKELAWHRYRGLLPHRADVELSEFREEIGFRWYMRPKDLKLTPEMLGETLDDCLVEFIYLALMPLKAGMYSAEQFKLAMEGVMEGMSEDPDLQAYAAILIGDEKLPLASETYRELAIGHAMNGGKREPRVDEGSRFARAMLASVMEVEFVETDMNMSIFSRHWADSWWRNPSPDDLLTLKQKVEKSAAAWDTLMLICEDAVKLDRIHLLPAEVLEWHLGASFGRTKRPIPKPAARNRPSNKIGYMHRDNEIRHTVRLLKAVGMPVATGKKAVADAFPHHISLPTVRRIYRELDWTPEDFALNFKERYQLGFYPTSVGGGTISGPALSS